MHTAAAAWRGGTAALWTAILVSGHTLWTSAAPALVYRVYAVRWGLAPTTTAALFAAYPLAVVATIVLSGDLADHIGRRRAMLLGIGASFAGTVLLTMAAGVGTVVAARLAMGIGVGLSAGPSTAAIVEHLPADSRHWGAVVTTLAQSAGFALSLVLGGIVLQFSPIAVGPQYWMLTAGLIALALLVSGLPDDAVTHSGPWRPRWPTMPPQQPGLFALAVFAVMAAMVHAVVVLSLGGQIAHDLVGSGEPALDGVILALFAVAGGITSVVTRSLGDRASIAIGGGVAVVGMAMLTAAIAERSLPIYAGSTIVAGIGYVLLFRGGLDLAATLAEDRHRAGLFSTLYLAGYGAMACFAIVLGGAALRLGLDRAVTLGCAAIIAAGGVLAIAATRATSLMLDPHNS